jgi:hypothetical protein
MKDEKRDVINLREEENASIGEVSELTPGERMRRDIGIWTLVSLAGFLFLSSVAWYCAVEGAARADVGKALFDFASNLVPQYGLLVLGYFFGRGDGS